MNVRDSDLATVMQAIYDRWIDFGLTHDHCVALLTDQRLLVDLGLTEIASTDEIMATVKSGFGIDRFVE